MRTSRSRMRASMTFCSSTRSCSFSSAVLAPTSCTDAAHILPVRELCTGCLLVHALELSVAGARQRGWLAARLLLHSHAHAGAPGARYRTVTKYEPQ